MFNMLTFGHTEETKNHFGGSSDLLHDWLARLPLIRVVQPRHWQLRPRAKVTVLSEQTQHTSVHQVWPPGYTSKSTR